MIEARGTRLSLSYHHLLSLHPEDTTPATNLTCNCWKSYSWRRLWLTTDDPSTHLPLRAANRIVTASKTVGKYMLRLLSGLLAYLGCRNLWANITVFRLYLTHSFGDKATCLICSRRSSQLVLVYPPNLKFRPAIWTTDLMVLDLLVVSTWYQYTYIFHALEWDNVIGAR